MKINNEVLLELEKLAKDAIDIREATNHWTDTKRVHCVPTPETVLELIRQIRIMKEALSRIQCMCMTLDTFPVSHITCNRCKALEQVGQ